MTEERRGEFLAADRWGTLKAQRRVRDRMKASTC
jgi:hypothetical protein